MSKKKKEDNNKIPTLNDLIINEAVRKYKEGEIKSFGDVEDFLDNLLQPLMQNILEAELDNHLERPKYKRFTGKLSSNMRNGHCKSKRVRTKFGSITIRTPRDRNATFEPVIIEKGQTTLNSFEDKCIALYAKGMSLRDIEKTIKEIYGVKINKDQISHLISVVSEETEKWRNRKLKPIYVFTYADCLYVPVKDDIKSNNMAIYVIIGVDANGYKDILGMWMDKSESASFWSNVFEDLKTRGVEEILYMSSDGVAGFKESLDIAFPRTQAQRCVVHLVRNLYSLCPRKQARAIIADYKKIYTSANQEEANLQLEAFKEAYAEKYPQVVKKATNFMQYLEPLFELPKEIRKCIYTTNAIESVNSALRKVTRGKGAFPNENAVYKVLFLRIRELKEKWNKPIQNWQIIQQQLVELFGNRYTKYLDL